MVTLTLAACGGRVPHPAAPARPSSHVHSPAKPAAMTVRVGWCCTSVSMLPIAVGQQKGFWSKEGVKVDFQRSLQGNAPVVKALVAGQLDIDAQMNPDSVIRADNRGASLRMIAANSRLPAFAIFAGPKIKQARELRGKTVVYGGLGGPAWVDAYAMLASRGIYPKDVKVIQNGNDAQRMAMLFSGRAAAAVLTTPDIFVAQAKGYNKLVSIRQVVQASPNTIVASQAAIAGKPQALLAFLRGWKDGVDFIRAHPNQASAIYAKWVKTQVVYARQAVRWEESVYTSTLSTGMIQSQLKVDRQAGIWKGPIPNAQALQRYLTQRFLQAGGSSVKF